MSVARDALINALTDAVRAGRYPSDSRYYIVTWTSADGARGAIEEYMTLDRAIDNAEIGQRLANAERRPVQYAVKTRDSLEVVYETKGTL